MAQYSDLIKFQYISILSGGSRGGTRGARPRPRPLFLDQNEARGAKKDFLGDRPPTPLSQGLDDRAPLFSEGLDPPLILAIRCRRQEIVSIYINIVFNNTTGPLFLEFKQFFKKIANSYISAHVPPIGK